MKNYIVTRYLTPADGYKKATWTSRPMTIGGAMGTLDEAAKSYGADGWQIKFEENAFYAVKAMTDNSIYFEISAL